MLSKLRELCLDVIFQAAMVMGPVLPSLLQHEIGLLVEFFGEVLLHIPYYGFINDVYSGFGDPLILLSSSLPIVEEIIAILQLLGKSLQCLRILGSWIGLSGTPCTENRYKILFVFIFL